MYISKTHVRKAPKDGAFLGSCAPGTDDNLAVKVRYVHGTANGRILYYIADHYRYPNSFADLIYYS